MGTYITITDVEAYLGQTFNGTTSPTTNQVNTWIDWASDEVDLMTHQTWGTVLVTDEVLDFTRQEVWEQSQTGWNTGNILPKGVSFGRNDLAKHDFNALKTEKRPIVSVTSLVGNTGLPTSSYDTTFVEGTDFIKYEDIGKIVLIKNIPSLGLKRFKITYVAGITPVPVSVQRLTTLLVSKEVLTTKVANSNFGNSDSITVGPISITKSTGQNISFLSNLDSEIDRLKAEIGVLKVELV